MRLFLNAATTLVLASAASVLAQPSIVSLGVGSGPKLNADGTMVVDTINSQCTRYVFNAGTMTAAYFGGQTGTGISANGLILCGNIQNLGINNVQPLTRTIAGRWAGGSWTDIPLFAVPGLGTPNPPGTLSTAYDLSADGRFMTGLAYNAADGNNARAFQYDANTNTTAMLPALVGPAGLSPARASAISDDGTVCAGFDQMSTRVPTVWTYDSGTSTWTETILNPIQGEIFGVSADGLVLVGTSSEFTYQGAYWTKAGAAWTATALPTPPNPTGLPAGNTLSRILPLACTANGSTIVGYAEYSSGFPGGPRYAFIWTSAGGFQWLSDYLTSLGATIPSTFSLGAALSISDDGSAITGIGSGVGSGPPWYVRLAGGYNAVAPAIAVAPPTSVKISLCDSFILNCTAAGTPPFTYQWYKNNVPMTNVTTAWGSVITGSTTTQLRITKQRPEDVGTYFCRVTGVGGQTIDTAPTVAALDNTAYPPPTNDTCATAVEIGEAIYTENICQAWTNEGASSCVANTVGDVWFRYTPSFTGEARIETCASNYNTVVSVFSGSCGALTGEVCNDNPPVGPPCAFNSASRIARLPVVQGVPRYIRVSVNPSSTPAGSLNINIFQAPPRPVNDLCANAVPATVGLNYFETYEATTDGAASCRSGSGNDLWYTYTPTISGKLTVATCGFTTMNTVLSLHASCAGPELACNDNTTGCGTGIQSRITDYHVNTGVPVLIRVAGNTASVVGTGSFNLSFVPDACVADIASAGNPDPLAGPDGFVTGEDFDVYVLAYYKDLTNAQNNLIADLTDGTGTGGPDGFITGTDFDFFVIHFFMGC